MSARRLIRLEDMVHEMRTPLTAIRGYLETALDERLDAATSRRFLEVARNETMRLGRLIDGMVSVSLLDVDYRAGPRSGGVMAQAALDRALDALVPRICERRTTIRRDAIPAMRVACAFDHLVQVFVNVIGNAIDHGGDSGTVQIAAEPHPRTLQIAVDDDGPGIPTELREAVFEFGYRAHSSGAQRSGSGLGLAVARRLLERTGGRIWATTSMLGGTRIVIQLERSQRAATG